MNDRKEAEEKAEDLVRKGHEHSGEITQRARAECERILADAEAEAARAADLIRKKGLARIEGEVSTVFAQGKEDVRALEARSGKKLDRAAKFLAGLVLGQDE